MKVGGVFIVGLLLGLVGGLIVTWFVVPVQVYDTYPPMLAPRYRQDWVRMTIWAYGLEGNWGRTRTRLMHLPAAEARMVAEEVLEQAVAQGQPVAVLQRLAKLAATFGASGPGITIYTGEGTSVALEPGASTPLPQPTATREGPAVTPTLPPPATPTPTLTPPPVSAPTSPFQITSQTLSCAPEPVIAVSLEVSRTVTERGRERQEQVGLPMREIWLIWADGADRAITGFQPEKGLGYADFTVAPGQNYNLYIDSPSGLPVLTVQVEPCPPAEGEGWVSRFLVIREVIEPEAEPDTTPEATLPISPTGTLTRTLVPTPSN